MTPDSETPKPPPFSSFKELRCYHSEEFEQALSSFFPVLHLGFHHFRCAHEWAANKYGAFSTKKLCRHCKYRIAQAVAKDGCGSVKGLRWFTPIEYDCDKESDNAKKT